MARTYELVVGPKEEGLRLDQYLVHRLPRAVSRRVIQRLVRHGAVTIGGRTAKPHRLLRRGERIHARIEALREASEHPPLTPQAIPLKIVYEDDHLVVVNKPPGLVTHPAPGHWDGTLVNALVWHLQQGPGARDRGPGKARFERSGSQAPGPRPLPRAGIVHRLDKDTSGLLLAAKTDQALTNLGRQLKARTMRRRYQALVEGHLPLDQGTIRAAIGRHARHRKEMTVRQLDGRTATTHYRVLRRYQAAGSRLQAPGGSPSRPFRYTLLEVTLETGRTHQIRVHMAHVRHPVLGDTTYGSHPASSWRAMGIDRQLLHAGELRFLHPATGRPMTLTAPLPEDMRPWIEGTALSTKQAPTGMRNGDA